MRPLSGIAVAIGLLFAAVAQAQTLTYGPIIGRGVTPDKMIVKWGTSSSAPATLYYRPHGTTVYQTITATASCGHSPSCDYEADLTGLAVGASYDYYVSPGGAAASPFGFNSCPAAGTPMDLVFYGDSRSGGTGGGPTEHKKLVGLIQARNPDMVFESGDLFIDGSYSGYLSEFFPAVGTLGSTTPFMATPGNHDNDSGNLQANYGAVLPVPKQNPTDAWRAYYSFVCGNVMFVGLDSNQSGDGTQKAWLQAQLNSAGSDATIDHVLVWFHHAPYSVGDHGDDAGTKGNWVSIFNASNKVKAVFSGHDHLYAQMSDGSHVVYCVSGGAGAQPYSVHSASAATTVKAISTYNYVLVHVAGKSLGATAYDDTNNVIDTWGAATTTMGDG
ncbi:MAG: metallophosphoesterase, partial [Mycobacterium sp.]